MAYEKEINEGLRNKYHKDLGLNDSTYEKVANILGATTEKAEEVTDKVNGAEGWLKVVQGEADIVRKTVHTPKPKPDPDSKPGTDPKPDPDPDPTDIKAIIAQAISPLTEKITQLEKEKSAGATRQRLIDTFKDKGVDSTFYEGAIEGREFDDDDKFNDFVEKITGNFTKFKQSITDKNLENIPKPTFGDPNKEGVSAATQAYIEAKTAETKANPLGGKAL